MNRRQKEKRKRIENKKLVEEFPFLLPRNRFSDKVPKKYNYSYTELDDMPKGWKKAFGIQLCKDLKEALIKSNFLNDYRIMQIKEKYGSLRWYDNGHNEEIGIILMKYEHISEHTCIRCGKINVPIYDAGWVSPWCEKCFANYRNNLKYNSTKKPEEFMIEPAELSKTIKVTKFSKEGNIEEKYDCSDILKKLNVDLNDIN